MTRPPTLVLLVFAAFIGAPVGAGRGTSDDAVSSWLEVFKNARVANQARLNSGSLRAVVTYQEGRSSPGIEARVRLSWDGPDHAYWEYQLRDVKGSMLGMRTSDLPVESQPVQYILKEGRFTYFYNARGNTLGKHDASPDEQLRALNLVPFRTWFSLQSAGLFSARPYTELIEELRDKFSVEEGEEGLVRFTREEDGFTQHIDFSPELGGNVVEKVTQVYDIREHSSRCVYSWSERPDGTFGLDSYELMASPLGGGELDEFIYRVKIDDLVLTQGDRSPVPSLAELRAKLPAGYGFFDNTRGAPAGASTPVDPISRLEGNVERLRSEGFLKRPR